MQQERALTVKEAMFAAKRALESVSVRVIGEVSEFNDKPGYKAAYFSVADGDASMPCMMWRDAYRDSGVRLAAGTLVEMTGRFSAYVPKGRMQFMVQTLQLAGEGVLRVQVAEIARRLEAEGLMRPERRRSLPRLPERIAVVTSPRGKAVHDVIRTLRRRYPLAELLVVGVQVEGVAAPAALVEGLSVAADAGAEVILLVRGGGSYEDLMPFNDERLSRAVAASPVPVVTGIGHEPDTSIADMVADFRASTPTAAAEAVAPSVEELDQAISALGRRMGRGLQHQLQSAEHRVEALRVRPVLNDPGALFGAARQRLDLLGGVLSTALPLRLDRDAERIERTQAALVRIGSRMLDRPGDQLALGAARLRDLSPLNILGRGYAVCYAQDGTSIVKRAKDVERGERIGVRVSEGRILAVVENTEE